MSNNFFDQDVKAQTDSLTLFARGILKKYGISDAQVECINFAKKQRRLISTAANSR